MAARPRRVAWGLTPLVVAQGDELGRDFDEEDVGDWLRLGHDGTPFRPTHSTWAPLAIRNRIARRRVEVCAVRVRPKFSHAGNATPLIPSSTLDTQEFNQY